MSEDCKACNGCAVRKICKDNIRLYGKECMSVMKYIYDLEHGIVKKING